MGSTWTGVSQAGFQEAEQALIERGGVKWERVNSEYIDISEEFGFELNPEHYIHHIEIKPKIDEKVPCGGNHLFSSAEEFPILVFVHGYASGGAANYRIFDDLSLYFRVFAVDLLGMGNSGRPKFDLKDVDETEDFFVRSLKIWKDKVIGSQKKIVLAGHSLGAYLSTAYSLRYSEDIEKLLLISPVGVPEKPENFDPNTLIDYGQSYMGKLTYAIGIQFWEQRFTIESFLRLGGRLAGKTFLSFMCNDDHSSPEENQDNLNYMYQICLGDPSSEAGLHNIIEVGCWARKPLVHRLPALKEKGLKVAFFYGDNDFMKPDASYYLLESGLVDGSIYIVGQSDHYLAYWNPKELSQRMIETIYGQEEALKLQQYYSVFVAADLDQKLQDKDGLSFGLSNSNYIQTLSTVELPTQEDS